MNNNFANHVDDKEIKLILHKFSKNNASNHLDIKDKYTIIFFYCKQINCNRKQKTIYHFVQKELF